MSRSVLKAQILALTQFIMADMKGCQGLWGPWPIFHTISFFVVGAQPEQPIRLQSGWAGSVQVYDLPTGP